MGQSLSECQSDLVPMAVFWCQLSLFLPGLLFVCVREGRRWTGRYAAMDAGIAANLW
jgi:hypothetical protein